MHNPMEFKNGMPPFSISLDDMSWNKTGSWRYMRPLYDSKIPPCTAGCPAHEKIPQYFALVKEKKYEEAWHIILDDNPMPGVLGRVCYHPCENVCNRGQYDEDIAIHNMERFVADQNRNNHIPESFVQDDRSQKVAIIGSGPAGLSAGYQLRRMGYTVTIFEAAPESGGMLRLGIPKYRLPREVLDKEIDDIKRLGVEIKTSTAVGKDIRWEALRKEYDSVLIATGAYKGWKLNIPGEHLKGISSGLAFLKEYNTTETAKAGKKLVVVGGGNTAIDTARSAIRLGADVTIVYRRSRAELPAVPEEIEDALKEGVKIVFLVNPVEFLGKTKVEKVRLIRMKLAEPDESGRRRPVPVPGSEFEIEADQVLLAIGETPDLDFLGNALKVQKNRLEVDPFQMTSEEGVFACGDAALEPIGTVVDAIATGKKAARTIHQYLSAETAKKITENGEVESEVPFETVNLDYFIKEPRPREKQSEITELKGNFHEVNLGISEDDAIYEANRCFSCGTCTYCDNCLIFCPDVAIKYNPDGKGYVINYDYCKGCGICVHECPRNALSFEEELKWSVS